MAECNGAPEPPENLPLVLQNGTLEKRFDHLGKNICTGATIVLKIVIAISSCESDLFLWCVVLSLLAASTCVLPSQSIFVFGITPISSFLKIDHLSAQLRDDKLQ